MCLESAWASEHFFFEPFAIVTKLLLPSFQYYYEEFLKARDSQSFFKTLLTNQTKRTPLEEFGSLNLCSFYRQYFSSKFCSWALGCSINYFSFRFQRSKKQFTVNVSFSNYIPCLFQFKKPENIYSSFRDVVDIFVYQSACFVWDIPYLD